MRIDAEQILSKISDAAQGAFADGWQVVQAYAPAEFKKMAVQIASIAENVARYKINSEQGYSPETGKLLFQMQKTACESVLVAVSQLTLLTVQKALNAIFLVLNQAFSAAFSFMF